jgi:hypothetical protein
MVRFGWFKRLMLMAVVFALPVVARSAQSATEPSKSGKPAPQRTVEKAQLKPLPPEQQNKMERVRQILAEMMKEARKYQYEHLFLAAGAKPVQGLVELPATTFTHQVEEIAEIAKKCREQMINRQAAARAHYEKIGAPQMAAFTACETGMEEVASLIESLRNTASIVGEYAGNRGANYYFELSRLERTIAKISALTEVCQNSMARANMVCEQFESKAGANKPSPSATY